MHNRQRVKTRQERTIFFAAFNFINKKILKNLHLLVNGWIMNLLYQTFFYERCKINKNSCNPDMMLLKNSKF